MKLAFSTLGCPDWEFKETMATAKDFGFDGVEIRGIKNEIYAPKISDFSEEKMPKTLDRIARTGVVISCVTSGICLKNFDMDTCGEKIIKEAREYCELAARLGAKFVRILGDESTKPVGAVSDDAVENGLRAILPSAEQNGIILLLETNGVYADTKRCADLVRKIGSPNLSVLWDVHHPYRFFGETIEASAENLKGLVKYVHVKDSKIEDNAVKYVMMGKGDVPLKELFETLKNDNYDGFVSLEWVKRWCQELEAPGIVFVQYIEYMKRHGFCEKR